VENVSKTTRGASLTGRSKRFYDFDEFSLDAAERILYRNGQAVALTPKAFDLLLVLVEKAGTTVEKDELMKRVWPDSFVEEANLSVNMTGLRRALGEGPDDHRFIETVLLSSNQTIRLTVARRVNQSDLYRVDRPEFDR
jgi:DNA-binding response OmpR family regulator